MLIALFEPYGDNLLMSIALKTADIIKLMDYPVVGDGQSVWRVDDGGKIDPKLFSILFAVRAKEGLCFPLRPLFFSRPHYPCIFYNNNGPIFYTVPNHLFHKIV